VVPDLPLLLRRRLVGRDVEPPIDLTRIRHHNLAAELERKLERQLGLADAGRADDDWNMDAG
jgi:hypothetical protein